MKVLPVKVRFELKHKAFEFKIELKNNSLVVSNGQIENDPEIIYNPTVPVTEHNNSNAIWSALLYMMELLSDQVHALSETDRNMTAGYLHRRIVKVSNNFFNVPLAEGLLNIHAILATTV